jgi:6-pyruvoyltetrahydropterin/6-carboxytetrahydropterin synthase
MVIRKLFKFEAAHIVRNCSSERCKYSIHGHSFKVEVFLTSRGLDRGGMVLDFGLLKREVGMILDAFDHSTLVWDRDNQEYIDAVSKFSERVIMMPFTPSAESLSILLFMLIDSVLKNTVFKNGEKMVKLKSVRVWETETGWAEADSFDVQGYNDPQGLLKRFIPSPSIIEESWGDRDLIQEIIEGKKYYMPEAEQQVKLD